ncbi:MAG: hypothetical protein ACRDG3_05170, partial [Tepidiformaceae bacterium]
STTKDASADFSSLSGSIINPGDTSLQVKCNQGTNNGEPLFTCFALRAGSLVVVEVDEASASPDTDVVTTNLNNALDYASKAEGS